MSTLLDLRLTEDQINTILGALGDQPYKVVANLIQDIRNQAVPQLLKERQNATTNTTVEQAEEFSEEVSTETGVDGESDAKPTADVRRINNKTKPNKPKDENQKESNQG